jgi:hypothetical protein
MTSIGEKQLGMVGMCKGRMKYQLKQELTSVDGNETLEPPAGLGTNHFTNRDRAWKRTGRRQKK